MCIQISDAASCFKIFFDTVTGVMILVLENFSLWKVSPQLIETVGKS